MATHALWNLLQQLKSDYEWVELSHRLNNDSPYWSGMPEGSVEIGKTVFDWGNPMLECLIQTFKFPGQFGTHIDFPGHFAKGTALSDGFGVQHMAYPLVVIDVSEKVAKDVHYAVTVDDIKAYDGACELLEEAQSADELALEADDEEIEGTRLWVATTKGAR